MNDFLLIAGGLILLFIGGETLVRGSVSVAKRLGVSELVIGLTLVGFGTSMPELVTSLRAVQQDAVGIAIGNVAGSNIANILLVLGVAALIRPIITQPAALMRDTLFMIGATILFAILVYTDQFTRVTGTIMVALLAFYIILSLLLDRGGQTPAGEMHADGGKLMGGELGLLTGLGMALAGVAAVVFGARLLVDGGAGLATRMGISEAVIGLTIVAIGTSLPELATSAISAMRGKSDVALGNILGSNIFNVLGILGVTALVKPFSVLVEQPAATSILSTNVDPQGSVALPILSWEDIGAVFLSVFLLVLFGLTGKKLARWEGAVLLGAYVLYLGMLAGAVPTPFGAAAA
ncbi:MAG: calcium/sodium antiporter [Pseudomonadota bacterium]